MSDTETLPPIAITPEQAQAMPEATRNTARTLYTQHYGAAEVERVFGQAPPTGFKEVTQPGSDTSVPHDGLTREQRVAGYKNILLVSADTEAVIASAERAGISKAELAYTPPNKEAVAAAQRDAEVDAGFAPPAKGESYPLQFERKFAEASDIGELTALNSEIQAAFKHAEVPAVLAQPLLDAIIATGEIYADESMTDAARELRFKEEGSIFRHVSRNPQEDTRLAAVGYNALPQGFREQLDQNYSLHSAAAQIQLAALGRAIEYRASKAKK